MNHRATPDFVRIGIHYRALAVKSDNEMAWFWIGSHAEYDRLLRG